MVFVVVGIGDLLDGLRLRPLRQRPAGARRTAVEKGAIKKEGRNVVDRTPPDHDVGAHFGHIVMGSEGQHRRF